MEEGSFRCDANISIRPPNSRKLLPKVEVKNMNSFKAVYQAMEYESRRQGKLLEEGGELVQETRGWVEESGTTVLQRTKEYAEDYRYFPEPDLSPLVLDRAWIEQIRARLPELPEARRDRFISQYGLSLYDASILTASRAMANYFEDCVKQMAPGKAKMVSNWLLGDFSRLLNATNTDIENVRISPKHLSDMFVLVDNGTISGPTAKAVLEEMFQTGREASEIVTEKKLSQISDTAEIREVVKRVIAGNAGAVTDYASGKQQALTFIVGQVMKATRGRANPGMVREIITQELGGK
jgi:aspartyl-tRNA(Asn)/glutamyl-tRNA(Gln) amidotransferase subunit B